MRSRSLQVLGLSLTLSALQDAASAPAPSLAHLDARALLDAAVHANGGEHLRALGTLTYTQTRVQSFQGVPWEHVTSRVTWDVPGERQLTRTVNLSGVTESLLVTPTAAFFSSAQMGTVPAHRQMAAHLRWNVWRGLPGLQGSLKSGTALTNRGEQTWALQWNPSVSTPEVSGLQSLHGTVLEVARDGVVTQYLLGPEGQLLADRQDPRHTDWPLQVYRNVVPQGGLPVPRQVDRYGADFTTRDTLTEVTARPSTDAEAFRLSGAEALEASSGPVRPDAPTLVTAQDVFDAAVFGYATLYHGVSSVSAEALRNEYRPQLLTECAALGAPTCPPSLAERTLWALVDSLGDAHTDLLNPGQAAVVRARNLNAGEEPFFLGTRLPFSSELGGWVVTDVTPGSAVHQAGWQAGDVITKVAGFPSVGPSGRDPNARAALNAFQDGKPTTFTRVRQGTELTGTVTLTPLPDGDVHLTVRPDRVAVLTVRSFMSSRTAQLVHDALRQAMDAQVHGVILDLRGNSGGLASQVPLTSGAFTDPAPQGRESRTTLTTTRYVNGAVYRDGVAVPGQTVQRPVRYTGPLVVLVDSRSASGAEYVARDLLARPGTAVMGEGTTGAANSTMQHVHLPDGSILAITVARTVDASGMVVSAAVSPPVYGVTDLARLVATGQDSLMEQAARWVVDGHR